MGAGLRGGAFLLKQIRNPRDQRYITYQGPVLLMTTIFRGMQGSGLPLSAAYLINGTTKYADRLGNYCIFLKESERTSGFSGLSTKLSKKVRDPNLTSAGDNGIINLSEKVPLFTAIGSLFLTRRMKGMKKYSFAKRMCLDAENNIVR